MTNISNNNFQGQQIAFKSKQFKKIDDIPNGPSNSTHYNGDDAVHKAFQDGKLKVGDTYTDGSGREHTVSIVVYNGRNKDGVMLGGWGG